VKKTVSINATTINHSTISDSSITTTNTQSFTGRRGNGARPVPTFNKRKFKELQSTIPPKKAAKPLKGKNFMKNITITHMWMKTITLKQYLMCL